MHVLVIGAGVVGVSSAYQLLKKGFTVSMVDRHAMPAQEASFANGCQLSYNYVAPLASPAVFSDLPKWIINPQSPLRFYPRLDWQQWRWLMRFMMACTTKKSERTTAELLGLAVRSQAVVHAVSNELKLDYSWTDAGKLIIYRDPHVFKKACKQVEFQANLGSTQQVLLPKQLLDLDASLETLLSSLAGGIFTPHEETGDCQHYTQQLFNWLQQQPNFNAYMDTEVVRLRTEGRRVVGVQTHTGDIQADHVVVAAGVQSVSLLKETSYTPLVYPLKGYSLTLALADDTPAGAAPQLSITDYERRIVYAPLTGRLRVAAMVDIGDSTASLTPSRLALLRRQASETFSRLAFDHATEWAGLRPATPTGKPIIGPHPTLENVWLNIGQGALGFTLAGGSAEAISQHIAHEALSPEFYPFLPR